MKTVELLAPAKDFEAAKAAIDSGADAIYIGGTRFGARHAAGNSTEEIRRVVDYAHQYGVRVHCTLNTLIWDEELDDARNCAMELIQTGIDALIVQDMALRRMNLPVELHASTQVGNFTPKGAKFLGEVGFSRVILERGLSLDEIREICHATSAEVECFVHGAICVGYSGRCFLSRSMSSRSGNRGACSQPCRLTWDLTDGKGKTFLKGKHLLSVRDMNLSLRIGDLLDAGVTSFKIEGRLKDVDYIRNVTAYYRRAIDLALASRPHLCRSSYGESSVDFTPDPSKSFTRGESDYFLDGKHRGVASFDTPKSVGEVLGRVKRVDLQRQRFLLAFQPEKKETLLSAGDGLCFVSEKGSFGTNLNEVNGEWIHPNRMDGIREGMTVCRNFDHRFQLQLARSRTRRTLTVEMALRASEKGIWCQARDERGVEAQWEMVGELEQALHPEKNRESIFQQMRKSGDTIFKVGAVQMEGEEWFIPASRMAEVRREVLRRLAEKSRELTLHHDIRREDVSVRYPWKKVTADENVTNHLARAFYLDHGVEQIEPPLEREDDMTGRCVMRSPYCIRREIGECLKKNPRLKGDLFLERGTMRYRLKFDCQVCEMRLIADSSH